MKPSASWIGLAVIALAACGGSAPIERAAETRAPTESPPFALTMLDVGTGLSILVRGEDFTLLYDAGSNDDRRTGQGDRAVAYLEALLGPSGPRSCAAREGANDEPERTIDHVMLSHPHRDHVSFLPDVLGCFAVKNAWDSGRDSDTDAYAAFLDAARREPGLVLHSGRGSGSTAPVREGDRIALGRAATATILSIRPDAKDVNDASIVVRLDLGRRSVLLTGDATGGERRDPPAPPQRGSVEADLLARHRGELRVDVLQVGHHGSKTSSRAAFLDAVSPTIALVSSGPMPYGHVVLPDEEIVRALASRGARVLRTDVDDEACRSAPEKVGPDADGAPGGCSAITLDFDRASHLSVRDGPRSD